MLEVLERWGARGKKTSQQKFSSPSLQHKLTFFTVKPNPHPQKVKYLDKYRILWYNSICVSMFMYIFIYT